MIEWSIRACLKSELIHRVVVSTDSEEYAEISEHCGAEVPFIRPPEISGDNSTDYDFIVHALDWFAANGGEPNLLVHIRPTTPCRSPRLIDEAITTFQKSPSASALRSVHEMSESAYKTFELSPAGLLMRLCSKSTELDLANNARQQFPVTYQANGYVDILSREFIRKSKLIHGRNVIPFITPLAVELDSEFDFEYLNYLIVHNPSIAEHIF